MTIRSTQPSSSSGIDSGRAEDDPLAVAPSSRARRPRSRSGWSCRLLTGRSPRRPFPRRPRACRAGSPRPRRRGRGRRDQLVRFMQARLEPSSPTRPAPADASRASRASIHHRTCSNDSRLNQLTSCPDVDLDVRPDRFVGDQRPDQCGGPLGRRESGHRARQRQAGGAAESGPRDARPLRRRPERRGRRWPGRGRAGGSSKAASGLPAVGSATVTIAS